MSRRTLITAVRKGLAAAADPVKAPAMQAYMKSEMPYYGVSLPEVRKVCRAVFATHPLNSAEELDDTVEQLFVEASHREERYAALQLADHRLYAEHQTPQRIPLYRQLVTVGAWWDTVDELAGNLIGPILLHFPDEVRPIVLSWTTDQHLWLRRSAIIAQLNHKAMTDLDLLTTAIDTNAADNDFFIRKAIGWALRQYARTNPDWVRRFVDAREDTLSGLSKREARKHL
jgi:3-methyladenine DNA glycosylase AlkD